MDKVGCSGRSRLWPGWLGSNCRWPRSSRIGIPYRFALVACRIRRGDTLEITTQEFWRADNTGTRGKFSVVTTRLFPLSHGRIGNKIVVRETCYQYYQKSRFLRPRLAPPDLCLAPLVPLSLLLATQKCDFARVLKSSLRSVDSKGTYVAPKLSRCPVTGAFNRERGGTASAEEHRRRKRDAKDAELPVTNTGENSTP